MAARLGVPMAVMHIIIDGYNFLHASAGTEHDWTRLSLEDARAATVNFLSTHRRPQQERLTIVFDGAGSLQYDTRGENQQGIEVVFSEAGVNADEVIRTMVSDAPNPRSILVVSADREIRDFVRTLGAKVIAPQTFLATSQEHHERRLKRPPSEPPEKFRGISPGEVEGWRRVFGFGDEEDGG